jgi:hypothetical protein
VTRGDIAVYPEGNRFERNGTPRPLIIG